MNSKNNNKLCTMNDGMRTILHVNKSMGVPRQMLFAEG